MPQMTDGEAVFSGSFLVLLSRHVRAPHRPDAFLQEHRRCGELDGGLDGDTVWLVCSCGAQSVHSASAPVVLKEEP